MARTVWWFRCRFTGSAISADGTTSPPNWRSSLATDILVRHRATASQGGLRHHQRHRNIARAFSIRQDGRTQLAGRPVVLVDDVMTTGATLFTAAKCLSAAGSGPVSALVVARVARPREP